MKYVVLLTLVVFMFVGSIPVQANADTRKPTPTPSTPWLFWPPAPKDETPWMFWPPAPEHRAEIETTPAPLILERANFYARSEAKPFTQKR